MTLTKPWACLQLQALRTRLCLGEADGGDFWRGVDRPGDDQRLLAAHLAKHMGHRHLGLSAGPVGQHGATTHIAHRINVRYIGAADIVDQHRLTVQLDAHTLQTQAATQRPAADSHQHLMG